MEMDAAGHRARRRAVMNDVRRKIEREAGIAQAAEDLAQAVESALRAAEAGRADAGGPDPGALRAALARFREAAGGTAGRPR